MHCLLTSHGRCRCVGFAVNEKLAALRCAEGTYPFYQYINRLRPSPIFSYGILKQSGGNNFKEYCVKLRF